MNERMPDELEVESLLRARPGADLPPSLSSGLLWREIEARGQPRSVAVLPSSRLDARVLLGLAWAARGR